MEKLNKNRDIYFIYLNLEFRFIVLKFFSSLEDRKHVIKNDIFSIFFTFPKIFEPTQISKASRKLAGVIAARTEAKINWRSHCIY